MISLKFLGAAQTVTGSRHLLQTPEGNVLFDCGLFQGTKPIRKRNWENFGFDVSKIDAIVVSHAHIDHIGYIPRLVKMGFKGKIHCTNSTVELIELLLLDSARIQEEHARYVNRKGKTKHKPALPLYTTEDAQEAVGRVVGHPYREVFDVVPGVRVSYKNSGHILGSAWIEILVDTDQGEKIIAFSGDIGRQNAPILKDAVPLERADVVLLESTYGGVYRGPDNVSEQLKEHIRACNARGGILMMPSFAVERTQELLYLLEGLFREEEINQVPVFIDSPMAVRATKIFRRNTHVYDEKATRLLDMGARVLDYKKLHLCESVSQSKAIANFKPPFIIIASSGMATAGRILHHLQAYLPDPKNMVLLVGYQSPGTRGWRLEKGEPTVRIFGEEVEVRCEVQRIEGLSGHGDQKELLDWVRGLEKAPEKLFLVHGERDRMEKQQEILSQELGWESSIPSYGEEVVLW